MPVVAAIEAEGIAAVQLFHAVGEAGEGCLDHDVVMRRHQAIRMDAPAGVPGDREHQVKEVEAIEVVLERWQARYSSRRDVVDPGSWEHGAREPGHRMHGTPPRLRRNPARVNLLAFITLPRPPARLG